MSTHDSNRVVNVFGRTFSESAAQAAIGDPQAFRDMIREGHARNVAITADAVRKIADESKRNAKGMLGMFGPTPTRGGVLQRDTPPRKPPLIVTGTDQDGRRLKITIEELGT